MTRLLFWIALVILVVAAVRSKLRAALTRAQGSATAPGAGPLHSSAADPAWRRVEDKSEPMACCARCGIYFPASETVRAGGRDYCSPAHAHPDAG